MALVIVRARERCDPQGSRTTKMIEAILRGDSPLKVACAALVVIGHALGLAWVLIPISHFQRDPPTPAEMPVIVASLVEDQQRQDSVSIPRGYARNVTDPSQ